MKRLWTFNASLWALSLAFLITSCATFETNAYRTLGVTAHSVDVAMSTWADESVAGRTSHGLDENIAIAHANYRLMMAQAKLVIDGYRSGTNTQEQVLSALQAVAANKRVIIETLLPYLIPPKQNELRALP